MSEFQGRHILITGASTGIGLSTATLLEPDAKTPDVEPVTEAKAAEATPADALPPDSALGNTVENAKSWLARFARLSGDSR